MKRIVLTLSLCASLGAFAQKGITFQVEKLEKPQRLLSFCSSEDLCKRLILPKASMDIFNLKKEYFINYPFNIVAKSQLPDSLVELGCHPFFNGMYRAYAEHRPFVLSPDMIWLLISQGFARHVNVNSEKMRHHFVDFSGKLSLIVFTNEISLDNPNSPWEKVFPEFTKQIAKHTGNEIINLLSADFTTTTAVEKVASEITIMETMKSYFEYKVYPLCGIPEITLQGTTEDWQKILDKTKQLAKYDLAWWTEELEPVLEEFVNASQEKINKWFWKNMFKYHSPNNYGAPQIIDGWIVKFFPYDNDGNRNNLKELKVGNREYGGNLPNEIVKVDLKYIDLETGIETLLELWAGFFGVEQNKENFALTPKIGWLIRKKEEFNNQLAREFEEWDKEFPMSIRVKEFPMELLLLKEMEYIHIDFIGEINIPDEFANVKIENISLSGKIDKAGIERIKKMFPNSWIMINGKLVNNNKKKE